VRGSWGEKKKKHIHLQIWTRLFQKTVLEYIGKEKLSELGKRNGVKETTWPKNFLVEGAANRWLAVRLDLAGRLGSGVRGKKEREKKT